MRVLRVSFLNWALALASALLSLALGEGALQILAPNATQIFRAQAYTDSEKGKFCQFHPILGWIGRPNVDNVFDVID